MEFWIGWFHQGSRGEDVRRVAQAAEALGFTGMALSDHIAIPKRHASLHPTMGTGFDPLLPYVEPFTAAAWMGAATERLRLMTYSAVSGMRDPFSIAKQAAALSDLTDGRFDLGITPGWLKEEMALLGHDPATAGRRFDEFVDVVRGLWNNDLFSFDGRYYNFEEVGVCPRPAVAPRILIGGHGSRSLERAARHEGWIGMNHSADEIAQKVEHLRKFAADSDRAVYMIPGEELTSDYIRRMQDLGVDGMVVMPWPPLGPDHQSAAAICESLEAFASLWIE